MPGLPQTIFSPDIHLPETQMSPCDNLFFVETCHTPTVI